MDNLIIKGVIDKNSLNNEERIFGGFGSVEVRDRQGDFLPISEFRPVMEKLMSSGHKIPIQDSHTNHNCGEVINYKFINDRDGNPGLYLTAKIYSRYDSDTDIWNEIKNGNYTGFSLGGKSGERIPVCDENGCYNLLKNIEVWEFSIVSVPANQSSIITEFNKLAKSLTFSKDDAKRIGDKLKVNWDKINIEEFLIGLEIELEHGKKNPDTNITDDNEEMTAKIVLAHLLEFPDYYSKTRGLPKMEDTLKKSRVYIKTPSEAPSGMQVYTGEKGGKYYETEEMQLPKNKVNTNKQIVDKAKKEFNLTSPTDFEGAGYILNDGSILRLPAHIDIGYLYDDFTYDNNKVDYFINRFMNDSQSIRVYIDSNEKQLNVNVNINQNLNDSQWNILSKIPMKEVRYDITDGKNTIDGGITNSIEELQKIFKRLQFNTQKSLFKEDTLKKENPILKYVRQCGEKWCVYSEVGKRLGTHPSKEDANSQLRAIEANKIHKAKVYVKNPSDTPQGVKLQEGKRGGHYYESGQESYESSKLSHEIKEVDPHEFESIKSKVPQNMRHFLSDYTSEQMKQKGIKTYLTTNKTAGVALNGDEIINLFSLQSGEGKKALIVAIEKGGRRLDCFDKRSGENYGLPDYYKKFGFKEVKREKNWTIGEPDVVYMSL